MRETLFLNLLNKFQNLTANTIIDLRMKNREKVVGAIAFANAHMKIRYNWRHKSLLLRFDDKAFLRLHKKYEMKEQHKKLDNQRCELFLSNDASIDSHMS